MSEIKFVSSKVIDEIVTDLIGWMYRATDSFSDGDFGAEELDSLAKIIQSIPTEIDVPKDFWVY